MIYFSNISLKQNIRHGQVSIEFVLIVLIATLLLLPVYIIISDQTTNLTETNRNIQVSNSLNTIVEASKIVKAQGPPSKMSVSVNFPSNINSIVIDKQEIIFYVTHGNITNSIVEGVDFNISGNLTNSEGLHKIIVKAVSSQGSIWVNISE